MSGRYSLRLRQRGNASVDNDDDANNDAAPSVAAAASTAVGRTALVSFEKMSLLCCLPLSGANVYIEFIALSSSS